MGWSLVRFIYLYIKKETMNKKLILFLFLILTLSLLAACKEEYAKDQSETLETTPEEQNGEISETVSEGDMVLEQSATEELGEEEGTQVDEQMDQQTVTTTKSMTFDPVESEVTLREYPDFLRKPKIVVDKGAPAVDIITATGIQLSLGAKGISAETILADEIGGYPDSDFIFIGEPCVNTLIKDALGIEDCNFFAMGVARIELVPLSSKKVIVLTGYDSSEIKKASDVLMNPEDYLIIGKKLTLGIAGSKPTIEEYN